MSHSVPADKLPRRRPIRKLIYAAIFLLIAVHLLYGMLAYRHLSLRHLIAVGCLIFFLMLVLYGIVAYVLLPKFWRHYYKHQPQLAGTPKITRTGDGIPGDPLNIGIVGSESEVIQAMLNAGWRPADQASVATVIAIAKSLVFHHPDPTAPVSNLYVENRKQDLAFERPDGASVKRRHHVRFWRSEGHEINGRTFWIGAATFDKSLRLSGYTGQVLHRIDADVDAERDKVLDDLDGAGELSSTFQTPGIGLTWNGRNGEGDWYYTDGQISVGVLRKNLVALPLANDERKDES